MKTRIVIICCIVLAICLWLLLRGSTGWQKVNSHDAEVAHTSQQPENLTAGNATEKPLQDVRASIGSNAVANTLPTEKMPAKVLDAKRQEILAMWQRPIDFYGKVVDENTNPVEGAIVQFSWSERPNETSEQTSTTTSDSTGLFSLHDKHGAIMVVSVGKNGYYASHGGQQTFHFSSFFPGTFSPDPLNPIVFLLHKKGQGDSLIEKDFPPGIGQIWQLHHDGIPIELDLLNGSQNVTGSGQLKLELWRDLSNPNAKVFDWRLQLSAPGGGLIPTDEEFAFQAPEGGYQSPVVIDMPATNENWQGEIRSKYYLQLPDGKYGRIDFYLLPRNGVFTVHSAINPSGSRNLEPLP
jgi:hypothetical protein